MLRHTLHRVWCYLAGLLILGSVVALHESGHWVASELCGAHSKTFNLGFGPGIQVCSVNGTEIWLRALPFGGYVELPMTEQSTTTRSIHDLSLGAKIFVFGAGIAVNLIIGVLLLWYSIRIGLGLSLEKRKADLMVRIAIKEARKDAAFKLDVAKFLGVTAQRFMEHFLNYCARAANTVTGLSEGGMTGPRGIVMEAMFLSLGLAIFNILPIPPLDGSRVFDALFYGGVLSGGRPAETVNPSEAVAIVSGLVFLAVPVVLGLIPGFLMACRFEVALYKRLREVRSLSEFIEVKIETGEQVQQVAEVA